LQNDFINTFCEIRACLDDLASEEGRPGDGLVVEALVCGVWGFGFRV